MPCLVCFLFSALALWFTSFRGQTPRLNRAELLVTSSRPGVSGLRTRLSGEWMLSGSPLSRGCSRYIRGDLQKRLVWVGTLVHKSTWALGACLGTWPQFPWAVSGNCWFQMRHRSLNHTMCGMCPMGQCFVGSEVKACPEK